MWRDGIGTRGVWKNREGRKGDGERERKQRRETLHFSPYATLYKLIGH